MNVRFYFLTHTSVDLEVNQNRLYGKKYYFNTFSQEQHL